MKKIALLIALISAFTLSCSKDEDPEYIVIDNSTKDTVYYIKKDTAFFFNKDTAYFYRNDTLHTFHHDTTLVFQYDTLHFYHNDTVYIFKHDTIHFITKDTIYLRNEPIIIEIGEGKKYNSLNEAVDFINKSNDGNSYILKLYEGIYNTVEIDKIDSSYKGLIIPNKVSIIGIGNRDKIIINGEIPDNGFEQYANLISSINLMMNGNVENVSIVSKNIRYCNHDDSGKIGMSESNHVFKNVHFICLKSTSNYNVSNICCGIGSQVNKEVVFKECVFENKNKDRNAILIHDNLSTSQQTGVRLYVENSIFKLQDKSIDIVLSNSGGNKPCYAYIYGNLMNSGIRLTSIKSVYSNVWEGIIANNKNCDIFKYGNMEEVDISEKLLFFNNE